VFISSRGYQFRGVFFRRLRAF